MRGSRINVVCSMDIHYGAVVDDGSTRIVYGLVTRRGRAVESIAYGVITGLLLNEVVGWPAGFGEAITAAEEGRAPASDLQPVDKHVGYPGVGACCDRVSVHSAGRVSCS
jgi:hypothetical protein